MAITRAQIVDALDKNLRQMHQDGLDQWSEEYSKVYNVITSDKQSEKFSYESGFKTMPQKAEGVAAEYDTIYPGVAKTITPLTYALGYELTEESVDDNLHTPETFAKFPKALTRSAMETVEQTAADIFNNGFTTTCFDGQYLFDTDHPLLSGGTQSNKPSTNVDLSQASLTAALTAFEGFVDERGLKRMTKAAMLLIPSALWATAEELIKSEFVPYSANNEVNALQAKDLRYFQSHYLTDTDAWFLMAEKADHQFYFVWRKRPGELRKSTDADSTNLKHLQVMRFGVDAAHYIGSYGSPGA